MNRIIIVCPYPFNTAASQRFRFEQYFNLLKESGYQYTISPFWGTAAWRVLYKNGHVFTKSAALVIGFLSRLMLLFRLGKYDILFLHREAIPIGPPWFEWIAIKLLRKQMIYDFDDAIWTIEASKESRLWKWLKFRSKVGFICKHAHTVSVGNSYLASYASRFNQRVIINPTTLETSKFKGAPKKNQNSKLVIGWTGTQSTLPYLYAVLPVLKQILLQPNVSFLVISNKPPDFELPNMTYLPWSEHSEVEDLSKIDIGIMPLPDNEWTRGKCGFKALQYMALGIPAVVSAVGINSEIVEHNKNGMLVKNEDQWLTALSALISDQSLREKIGKSGRETVEERFSSISNSQLFLSLFQ